MTAVPGTARPRRRDSIDEFVAQWRRERPDLDPWPLELLGRIQRLSAYLLRYAEARLATIGLAWETFSLIVTLRRSGAPFALRPTDLYRQSLLSSGTITNRIDRVVEMGLATRKADPNDRRGVIVRLTPKGHAVADEAIALHFEAMAVALAALTRSERRQTARLLSKLLIVFEEGSHGSGARNKNHMSKGPANAVRRVGAKPRAGASLKPIGAAKLA